MESFFINIIKKRWLGHLLFWIFIIIVSTLQATLFSQHSLHYNFVNFLALLPSQVIAGYFLTYYQIPKYIFQKKYIKFIISFLATLFILALLARILTVHVAEPINTYNLILFTTEQESIWEILTDPLYALTVYVPSLYINPFLFASLNIIVDKIQERNKIETLKQEKTKAELNFLKAQIHPHFLLNTLNNLYALTLKKSDKAPETVIKLSEMLVYTLYKCDEKYVPLDSEIKLLENYISLEKLRYGNDLNLQFNKDVENKNIKIAPLILLSIVENAFKHGVSGETEDALIRIDLTQKDELFEFEVFNTKSEVKQKDETDYTKGIGIENVKKQLDLVYPKRYVFEVTENEKNYKVFLKLNLKQDED